MTPKAMCTAVIKPGKITQRVDRVVGPSKAARDLMRQADLVGRSTDPDPPVEIAAPPQAKPNLRRLGPRKPSLASRSRPFRAIGVSVYCDVLERIDAAVDLLKGRGHSKMSRSELLRIAFERLSIDDIAPGDV